MDMVNMAGIISNPNALFVTSRETEKAERWILDSGATCHITSKNSRLSSISSCVGRKVLLPNGEHSLVTHVGECKVVSDGILKNVLVVPEFKYDLLSVSQLTRQLRCSVNFFREFFVIQDLSNGKVKGIGKEVDGLYYFSTQIPCRTGRSNGIVTMTQHLDNHNLLWHNRLGHPSIKVLKHMSLYGVDLSSCNKCTVCPLAKQTRLPFQISMSRADNVFDLLHLDVWGPYRTATHNGCRFFLTIVDDNSRMTWLYLMKMKSDVFARLKSFLVLVQNQFNKNV